MEQFLKQNPHIKALVTGTRRTDPFSGNFPSKNQTFYLKKKKKKKKKKKTKNL